MPRNRATLIGASRDKIAMNDLNLAQAATVHHRRCNASTKTKEQIVFFRIPLSFINKRGNKARLPHGDWTQGRRLHGPIKTNEDSSFFITLVTHQIGPQIHHPPETPFLH